MICANIFSHFVGDFFIFLMQSYSLVLGFGVKARKKSSPRLISRSLPPMFSFRSFMVSGLKFKSLIHFQLIFFKIVVQFHSVACDCPVFPVLFIEETILVYFPVAYSWLLCHKLIYMHGSISRFSPLYY